MIGKRLINTGVAAEAAFTPSEHFETVTYTGNGGTQRIGGYINRGGVFNGSSSKITSSVPKSSDQSFSFWTNHGSQSNSTATYFGYSNSASNGFFAVQVSSGNISILYWNGSTYARNTSTTSLTDGDWHHVVVTTSGNVFNIYVDGNTTPAYTTTLSGFTHASRSDLQISYETPDGSSSYFNGKIDQFRVFNKVISSSEITTLYGETYASSTVSTTDIFSDNSGVALYQLDGNANDTGKGAIDSGQSAEFNGTSSYISLSDTAFQYTTFSISAWIKPSSSGNYAHILENYGASPNRGFLFRLNTDDRLALYGYGSVVGSVVSNSTISINKWTHVAVTITPSSWKMYINGVQNESSSTATTISHSGTQSTHIGAQSATSSSQQSFFWGQIDDLRVYNDELTSTEIGYLVNNDTANIPTTNLQAYYKLDGDATDEQGNYNGTANNIYYSLPAEFPVYNGTATNVTYQEATKFQPDLVWVKGRTVAKEVAVFDTIRGADQYLSTGTTGAEFDGGGTSYLSSFDSNGFTVLNGASNNRTNGNYDYVAWCFKAGGTAVSNTDGSITSTVSANQDAGFSIAEYTSTGTNGSTIGHGLLQAPELIIIKCTSTTSNWIVYSQPTGASYLYLNSTSGFSSASWLTSSDSTFTLTNTYGDANTSGRTYISYNFHSVDGYSKIGSYTGTAASGNSVITGFEPQFVMIKRTDSTSNWAVFDNERNTQNPRNNVLFPNDSAAEADLSAYEPDVISFNSNGFTINDDASAFTGGTNFNISGGTYIYLAIAADPDTTTPTVENSFDVVTYTGDGGTQEIATDFKPDLVWIKSRTNAYNHVLLDSVRGGTNVLVSNGTSAEIADTDYIQSFNSNGFTIKYDSQRNDFSHNINGDSYVAWCWKAGDHDDNLPQINTEGTIDSVVSVNAAAGFSIVKGTAISSGAFTVGHGLSQAPEFYVIKNTSGTGGWIVYTATTGAGQYLVLNDSASAASNTLFWNNTAPSSTVFQMNAGQVITGGADFIAYCFHSVSGYQKIGSYTGATAGVSVTTGFRPRFLLIKSSSHPEPWIVLDTIRGSQKYLSPSSSGAEGTGSGFTFTVSDTGFSFPHQDTADATLNQNGYTYIYLAIA